MGSRKGNFTGLAGEFRVMSELLLRGHNPAKSYLNDGVDMVLKNGKRLEVKSCHKLDFGGRPNYHFSFRRGRDNKFQDLSECDFIICWCIDDNDFYIFPIDAIKVSGLTLYDGNCTTRAPKRYPKYQQYKNAWELLK